MAMCSMQGIHAQYWGKNTESEFTNEANNLAVDLNGNTYTAGYITGETAFEINVVQNSALGNGDIYVAKYSSTGSLLWVRQFGGNNSDRAINIAVDNSGFVYVTGQFFGTVNFDGNIVQAGGTSKDIFLIKLNPAGTVLWAISEGGSGQENVYGITTDQQNNVILTGQFSGSSTIAGQSFTSMTEPLSNLPSNDLFVSKYDSNGNVIWVKTGIAEYEDRGMAVTCDGQNNIILIGQFSDTLNFDGQIINNGGYNVGFVTKLNPTGQTQWFRMIKAGMLLPYSVAVNTSDEIVITGDYLGTLQYIGLNGTSSISNNYYRKIFVLKTDSSGSYIWGNSLGSNNELSARSVAINSGKDIFVTGYFKCDLSELHDSQPNLFNSVGFRDLYLWHLNDQGTSVYLKQAGSKKDDQGLGIALLNNQPIICGSYTEEFNFPSSSTGNYTISLQDFSLQEAQYSNEPFYYYLHGDDSRNSFLTNALHATTSAYDYFYPQGIDSLSGYITGYLYTSPEPDTIHICVSDSIYYDANTYYYYGPTHSYSWNTGSQVRSTLASTSGNYEIEVERTDGCSTGFDSVIVVIHLTPDLPLMSDSLGLAVSEIGNYYYEYQFCAPVSIPIWFNDLDSNLNIEINGPGTLFIDTLPQIYTNEGWYTVSVWDSYCDNLGYFNIDLDYAPPHDVIPYMTLLDEVDYNDSISICQDDFVTVLILDSVTNPTGDFYLEPVDPLAEFDWTIQPAVALFSSDTFNLTFLPTASGWYTITYYGSFGYDNLCGLDTTNYIVVDSFYVEVLSQPFASAIISGDNLICPNGSVYLTVNQTYAGLNWYGPAVNWVSTGNDSAQVTSEGTYHYKGWLMDSITGCEAWYDFSFTLTEKSPPNVSSNPVDGIICPNDSVMMWVDSVYLDYNWYGPEGDSLSLLPSHVDEEQGFYYVTVTDSANCSLTSPPFEIREYSTPYLSVSPGNVLCWNDSTTITAIFDGSGQVNWISPFVSSSSQITVYQAGWYVCELTQCGITNTDSVYIIDGTFNADLSVTDTILCYGEQAVISAPPGMSIYEWNTGEMGISSILSEQDGSYYVTLTNIYGCENQSDTVNIDFIENSTPPIINDVSICDGASLLLTNLVTTEWYTSDTLFLTSGITFYSSTIESDTSFLAGILTAQCPLVFSEVFIDFIDSLPLYDIVTPTGVCLNDSVVLSVNTNGESINWYLNGILSDTNNSITVFTGNLNSNIIQAEIFNSCFSYVLVDTLTIYAPEVISLMSDSVLNCTNGLQNLSLSQNLSSVLWTGYFGQIDTNMLSLPTPISQGFVYVQGIDSNNCITNSDSVYVQTIDLNVALNDNMNLNCEGDEVTLGSSEYGNSFEWLTPNGYESDSVISIFVNTGSEGWYHISVSDSFGCVYGDSVFVDNNPLPSISLPDDTILCMRSYLGGSFFIDSFSYFWSGYGLMDSIVITQDGVYYLTVEDPHGCIYKDSVTVDVVNCDDQLPNVFTPNNDGINDFFVIDEAPLYPNNTLIIVNRWGNIVYQEDGYNNTFDGTGLADGTYFYTFHRQGSNNPNDTFEGHLTIIR